MSNILCLVYPKIGFAAHIANVDALPYVIFSEKVLMLTYCGTCALLYVITSQLILWYYFSVIRCNSRRFPITFIGSCAGRAPKHEN